MEEIGKSQDKTTMRNTLGGRLRLFYHVQLLKCHPAKLVHFGQHHNFGFLLLIKMNVRKTQESRD